MNILLSFLRKIVLLAFCLLPSSMVWAADEQQERLMVRQDAIDLFAQENWKGLDALFVKYRTGFPTTSGGAQKLTVIYAGLQNTFGGSKEAEQMVDSWIKANPQSSAAYTIKSMMIEQRASQLRGEGPINTVDPAIIPDYKKLLGQAVKVMLDNKKVGQTDPMWYAEMIMLSKLQGDSAARRQWLKEGSDRFPEFQGIYLEAMIGALPKWGGSPEEVDQVARLAAEKNKDKTGLSLYTYIWYNAFSNQPELMPLLAQNKIVNWNDMRQGWDDRLKSYPGDWIRNGYLTCACLAGDKKAFGEQAKLLGGSGNVIKKLWLPGLSFQSCQKKLR